jgi:phage tail sheath protein FI
MPIQLSPGVQVVEKDFTQIVPAVSASRGAMVGNFKWGPILQPTVVTSQGELINAFRAPDDNNFESFYTATNFLAYSNNLLVTRVDTGPSRNAVSLKTGGISTITVTNGGAGYRTVPKVFASTPETADGSSPVFTAVLSGGPISASAIVTAGTGYVVGDVITLPAPSIKTLVNNVLVFDQATAEVSTVSGSGAITGITITYAGNGYVNTIDNAIEGSVVSSAGELGSVTFTSTASSISKIIINNRGSGYTESQIVDIYIEVLPDLQDPAEISTEASATVTVVGDAVKIQNSTHYFNMVGEAGLVGKGEFVAKYAGELGNSLSVSLCDSANWIAPATGTVSARHTVEDREDERELIVLRIIGEGVSSALSAFELDAGKIARTATAGLQKLVGEIDHVDTTVTYRKITLVSDALTVLRSQSLVAGDVDVYVGANKVGEIDGLYKYWNDLDHQYELSEKVFYVRLDDVEVYDITVNNILKVRVPQEDASIVYETIGVVESVENVVVAYLKAPAQYNIFDETFTVEWKYKSRFNKAPGTSAFAAANNGSNDEIHMVVVDSLGKLAPAGTVIEQFAGLSKGNDGKVGGRNNYYKDVINSSSNWVWWSDHPAGDDVDSLFVSSFAITPSSKDISAFANYNSTVAGTVKATSTAHGLVGTSSQVIAGTTNYNGTYLITVIDADNFYFTHAWVATETGTFSTVPVNYNPGTVAIVPNKGIVSISNGGYLSFTPASNWDLVPFAVTFKTNKAPTVVNSLTVSQNITNVFSVTNLLDTFKNLANVLTRQLSGGVDTIKAHTSNGNLSEAYDLYQQSDLYDISLIPVGNVNATVANYVIQNVAEKRKDCVAFISPPLLIGTSSVIATQIANYRNTIVSSSYGVMDSTWKYQYDKYSDKYRWIPMNGDTAGLCANTDKVADPWFSPGGFNRGVVKNIIKVAFNPNEAQRDILYQNGVNPIVTFPGQGTVLYGDKTLLKTPSAFDRINVRRLFIVLEKAISTASKYQLFEFNDQFTRAQFKNIVEPYLRDVQGRRGITDFMVKCDESNNTPQVIDSNQFIADIYIKPNRSINFITLNFIAAKTGASFEELGI